MAHSISTERGCRHTQMLKGPLTSLSRNKTYIYSYRDKLHFNFIFIYYIYNRYFLYVFYIHTHIHTRRMLFCAVVARLLHCSTLSPCSMLLPWHRTAAAWPCEGRKLKKGSEGPLKPWEGWTQVSPSSQSSSSPLVLLQQDMLTHQGTWHAFPGVTPRMACKGSSDRGKPSGPRCCSARSTRVQRHSSLD